MFFNQLDIVPFILQCAFGLLLFYLEKTGRFQLAYSKFRKGGNTNARLAMILIYAPAPLVYVAATILTGLKISPYHEWLLYAFIIHFGKRCYEILFVHKYSRPMGMGTVFAIGTLYAGAAWSAATLHGSVSREAGHLVTVQFWTWVGGAIFASGQMINLYHHLLLAKLRKDGSTDYLVPTGGLFGWVACPHYLGEIIAWFGYAVMSGFLPVLGIAMIMSLYLLGRALRTLEWYRTNVSDFPASRKALIPGIL